MRVRFATLLHLIQWINSQAQREKAGVDPRYEVFEGDDAAALALVISLNVQLRDLTAAQRAIVAARARTVIGKKL